MAAHVAGFHSTSRISFQRRQALTRQHVIRARTKVHTATPAAPLALSTEYQRDPELQSAIDALFADTIQKGRKRVPLAEIQHHVDRIAELGSRLGLNKVRPEWNDGSFQELITTNVTGVSQDSVSTMQRLTFGTVRPSDLQVNINAEAAAGAADKANQFKGPLSGLGGQGYALNVYFQILANGALGKLTVKAAYDTEDEDKSKLGVTFNAFRVEPASQDPQSLAAWREALAEHNPNMDASGAIEIVFPKSPRAFLRYILMEPHLQMSIGGSGDFLVVKRVP